MKIMLFGLALSAAMSTEITGQSANQDLQKEVEAAMRQSAEAQAECRLDDLRAMQTPDWMITFPAGTTATAATFLQKCTKVKRTIFENIQVRVYGGDTAVVTGQFRLHRPDGTTGPLNRISQVWIKEQGKWLSANSHVTTIQQPAK
jgi:ketosteroid isomerase-like protein